MPALWPSWLSPWKIPSQCWACHAWPCTEILCNHCWHAFHQQPWRCTGCAQALPGLCATRPRCGACLRQPPAWQHCHAWSSYEYPWSHLLTQWKFAQQAGLAYHFAHWMQQSAAITAAIEHADVVIPVPLSNQRMRERGYNPAAQIVQRVAPHHHLLTTLLRKHHTPPQSDLSRAQRLRNVRTAFHIPAWQQVHIRQRHVLLVDDVMTTGATLHAATRCLLRAGAANVQVLCIARTP